MDCGPSTSSVGPGVKRFMIPDASDDRPKNKRSKLGCLTCRQRRIKCDQQREECGKCLKSQLVCKWPQKRDILSSSDVTLPSSSADGAPTQDTYTPVYLGSTNDPPPADALHSPTCLNNSLAVRQELDQLLQSYFRHFHPVQANGYIHRATFLRECHQGTASPLLVQAVCAVSARYLSSADPSHPDGGSAPAKWAQQAKHRLMDDADRYNTSKLAATLILAEHEYLCGRNGSAWMLASMAARMTIAMSLTTPNPHLPWLEQETRRRLVWATFSLDAISSAGVSAYAVLPSERIHVDLPSTDHNFAYNLPPDQPELGLMARFVQLMIIRTDILRFLFTRTDQTPAWFPGSKFDELVDRLRQWREALPPELEYSLDNMYVWQGDSTLDALLLLHMWHDQLYATLYRCAIPGADYPGDVDPARVTHHLNEAPPEWAEKVSMANWVRTCAMRHKFETLDKYFPQMVPTSWHLAMFAFNSTREGLLYLSTRGETTETEHQELTHAFEIILRVLQKMARKYPALNTRVRDLARMMARSGYPLQAFSEPRSPSGERTPMISNSGETVMSQTGYLRRFLQHTRVETPRRSYTDPVRAFDPVAHEPLQSPLASSNHDSVPSVAFEAAQQSAPSPQQFDVESYLSLLNASSAQNGGRDGVDRGLTWDQGTENMFFPSHINPPGHATDDPAATIFGEHSLSNGVDFDVGILGLGDLWWAATTPAT